MAFDKEQERELQARFEQLRADGQLCPCDCENCPLQAVVNEEQSPRTHKDVVNELKAVGDRMRHAPTEAEHDQLLDQWNLLRGESAAFIRKANEEFCRQHPEQCLPQPRQATPSRLPKDRAAVATTHSHNE